MSEFNNSNNPLRLGKANLSLISQLSSLQCELANAMAQYVLAKQGEDYSFYVTEEKSNVTFSLNKISVVRNYLNNAEKCKMLMQWVVAIVFSYEKKFSTNRDSFSMLHYWLKNGSLVFEKISTTSDFPFAALLESVMKHLLAHLYISRHGTTGDVLETGFENLKLNDNTATLGLLRNLFRDFCNYSDKNIASKPFNDFSKVIKNARNCLSHYDPNNGIQELERHKKAEFFVLTTFIYAATTLSIEKSKQEGRRIILTCTAKVNDDDKFIVLANDIFLKPYEFKKEHIEKAYPRCLVLKEGLLAGNYQLTVTFPKYHIVTNQTINVFRGSFLEEPVSINIDSILQNGTNEMSDQPNEERKQRNTSKQQPISTKPLTLDEKKKRALEACKEPQKRFKRGIVIQAILFGILFCIDTWSLWPLATSANWLEWIFHYTAVFVGTIALFLFLRPKGRGLFVDISDNGTVSIPGVSQLTFWQWLLTLAAWLLPLGLVTWFKSYVFTDDSTVKHFFHCWASVFFWVWEIGSVLPCLLNGIARWNGFYYAPLWKFELPCTNSTIGIKENYDWYDKAKSYFFGFLGGRIVESFQWFLRTMATSLVMLGIWFSFIYKYVPQVYEKEFGHISILEKQLEGETRGEYYTRFELTRKELFMHVGDTLNIFNFISYAPEIVEEYFTWATVPDRVVRMKNNGVLEALASGETILTLSTEHSGFTGKVKIHVKSKKKGVADSSEGKESIQKQKNDESIPKAPDNDIPEYYTSLHFTTPSIHCKVGDIIDLKRYLEKEPQEAREKIEWQSSIPEYASITKDGILNAHIEGKTVLVLILAKNAKDNTYIEVHINKQQDFLY